jgi:hypothetical protein
MTWVDLSGKSKISSSKIKWKLLVI